VSFVGGGGGGGSGLVVSKYSSMAFSSPAPSSRNVFRLYDSLYCGCGLRLIVTIIDS
jgi:hypothetical protein